MERDLWHTLRERMKTFGHFDRIENMVGVGMPDVTYAVQGAEGFIELKWRARWPRTPADVVTLDHFTPQQRIWIKQRRKAGGRVYVLLLVDCKPREYLLLPGEWAAAHLGLTATRADVTAAALVRGTGAFPTTLMLAELSSRSSGR